MAVATKLLRTKRDYTFGRKGTDLIVNNKKISGDHAVFYVGEFDVENPTATPNLSFKSLKKKFSITREGKQKEYDGGDAYDLRDGDKLTVLNVELRDAMVLLPGDAGSSSATHTVSMPSVLELTSRTGINLVSQPSPEVTHHLTPSLSATASLAASLITTAQLVKPEWLEDLVKLGDEAHRLPAVTKYRPQLDASLEERHKQLKVWEPNEERLHIFKAYRFLCVGEKAREVPLDLRQMIARGDGTLESFDIHLGVEKFRLALRRGKSKEGKKLVVVGDEALLKAAVGEDVLNEFAEAAKGYGHTFQSPDVLIQAVLDVDISKLEAGSTTARSASPQPAPEDTPPAEEEIPASAPKPKLRRRRAPSAEASAPPPPPPPNAGYRSATSSAPNSTRNSLLNPFGARKELPLTPSTKMKQLQWDKLPQTVVGKTLWKEDKPQKEQEILTKLQKDGVWMEMEEDFKAKQLVINLLARQKRAELKSVLDPQTKKRVGLTRLLLPLH
ncbi:hypothetical protein NMY22_g13692 [Coprinellus aureogranulatus]|nr:hypothetical protein NMY22_g13692 [Coprinellus aureogranulatus]